MACYGSMLDSTGCRTGRTLQMHGAYIIRGRFEAVTIMNFSSDDLLMMHGDPTESEVHARTQ